jgi:tetratricopeptide (TPR) repeat protein
MVLDTAKDKILEIIRQSVERADEFKQNAKLYPRPSKDVAATLSKYLHAKQQVDSKAKSSEETKFNNVTSVKHSSLKQLHELEPITLKDMNVNHIHLGRFLLCRTIEEPFYLTSLTTIVQDENDEIENLCLYNFSHDYDIDTKVLLPNKAILIIKEPYLCSSINNMEEFYIRVESSTDIMILTDLDMDESIRKYFLEKWYPVEDKNEDFTFEKLNSLGNKCFSEKSFHQAIRCYTQALNLARASSNVPKSEMKKTLNNRSLVNLKLEKYCQAYQDALKSTQIEDKESVVNNEKAYFRIGKAEYNMRQYESALDWFTKCLSLSPGNKEARLEADKVRKRIYECKDGIYDFKCIIELAKGQKQMRLDLADFVSSKIEVASIKNDPNYKGFIRVFFNYLDHII